MLQVGHPSVLISYLYLNERHVLRCCHSPLCGFDCLCGGHSSQMGRRFQEELRLQGKYMRTFLGRHCSLIYYSPLSPSICCNFRGWPHRPSSKVLSSPLWRLGITLPMAPSCSPSRVPLRSFCPIAHTPSTHWVGPRSLFRLARRTGSQRSRRSGLIKVNVSFFLLAELSATNGLRKQPAHSRRIRLALLLASI